MTHGSSQRTALLAGAMGLVGGHLLRRLIADPRYERVVTVSRKELGIEHPKLQPLITNFDAIEAAIPGLGETVDDAFCALGTTIKTAGSRQAFRRVDFGYVVAFASSARAAGAQRFMLVSAIGASARSAIFYLRVKGETEEALAALGYPGLHIFRPGLLLGHRAEPRPREALGMALAPFLNPLMRGPAKAYRSIPADTVAAAIIAAAELERTGRCIHTYADYDGTRGDRTMRQGASPRQEMHVRCCIAGGGPAGMVLGFLLARAGVDVVVLEKHADFLRDFRGDTIHPSTLEVMHELGLLDEFLQRPHSETRHLDAQVGDVKLTVADFSHLPTRCKFLAFMPQWDFLNFFAEQARRYPAFHLKMQAEVTELIQDGERITGVRANTPEGVLAVHADLTVGADGRHSTVREKAGLEVIDLGAPMDALWLRLSRRPSDPQQSFGRIDAGRILAMIDRGDYWQCAYVIPKGAADEIRRSGLASLRDEIARLIPFARDRVGELGDWNEIKLLTVRVDRLRRWYRPGVLCIGDAAHAMSPIGGVGINLAIQDAVATANILASPLRQGAVATGQLRTVQRRRELPTRLTQRLQIFLQNRVIRRVLGSRRRPSLPLLLRLMQRWPLLRRIPARVVGIGFRPEHVKDMGASRLG